MPANVRKSRWLPAFLVALVVSAVIAIAVVATRPWQADGGPPVVSGQPDVGLEKPVDLVVRDGDRIGASGTVIAAPGKPVRFCAPAPQAGFDDGNDTPRCVHGVPVTGVDLSRLASAKERGGAKVGEAYLRGIWRDGVLAVDEQSAPARAAPVDFDLDPPPCPAPAGGWKRPGSADGKALHEYVVIEHPEDFRRPWVAYPEPPADPSVTTGPPPVEVLVVEVVARDAGRAERELRRRYQGNLCVVHTPDRPSLAEQTRRHDSVAGQLTALMRDPSNGVYASGGSDRVAVELVMLTPRLYEQFAALDLAVLEIRPWLRPAPS